MGRPKKDKITSLKTESNNKEVNTTKVKNKRELQDELEILNIWIPALERSVAYCQEHNIEDEAYYHTRKSLAKAKGRKIFLESLVAKGEEDETK